MFYCEQCKEKNRWPTSLHRSFGPCELCGNVGKCYDVKSHNLPIPEEIEKEKK